MLFDVDYYSRFPAILQDALINKKIEFPDSLQCEYKDLVVYRGVSYSKDKAIIDKSDFLSNMERNQINPMVPVESDQISSYSCSCYLNMDDMRIYAKFPRKNKAIAKGTIQKEFGPIDINTDTSHVDLYLFDKIDPSEKFEVVEKWEKNG